ncbi:FtsX-like permease family protein [Exiguobacterium sp. K1]|uniref:FtsX-like permease family protein n=1 Tax=Exiguobacterium sp. K1 TaxID=2980105 RepID=UPI00299D0436|nr:FtsX-like permease family protein [Exiguobacterium sp. K1]MDX1258967.1 ABC transporter permease [Exiguobacterium sp. K1]
MLKFIWNSWWRNKERFILLLVGVLIVSTGLSYLIGTTQANNGTVVDELQKRWGSSYDIVVRPPDSRSVTEDLKLLEPNYMSGLDGGITRKQYETIKQITDVEVAAPIAMIGNYYADAQLGTYDFKEPGIYKVTIQDVQDTGLQQEKETNSYFLGAGWSPSESDGLNRDLSPQELGKQPLMEFGSATMLAGIDPEAEAKLVGLDQATKKATHSRYFTKDDIATDNGNDIWKIPLILNSHEYVDAYRKYRYEKVDVSLVNDSMTETVQDIMEKGGKSYLKTLPLQPAKVYKITTNETSEELVNDILKGTVPSKPTGSFDWMYLKPSSVEYQALASPFATRWPFAYQITPQEVPEDIQLAKRTMYRKARTFGDTSINFKSVPKMTLNFIGVFDPQKLNISKDPLTELPMETYFPAKAQWVMDKDERPVNPVRDVKPTNDPYDFLTKPPSMLTTLDAAFKLRGDKAISAIRVNVKGVEAMNATSEKKLQAVAQEIEDKTGLITDVTLGSSPQLALTYLPGLKNESALGWVQQPWIKLGSSMAIFQEAKVGMSGVIASVIAVALVYVFSSNIILLYARKKEFAILLSLGWRPRQLSKLLFLEATLLGTFVALISWTILGSFWLTTAHPIALGRILLIGLAGLLIYWGGTLVPMALIRRIRPFESMRSGEVSKGRRFVRSQSIFGMSLNQLFTYWQRTLLSIIAIVLPTSLFIFFLFVTFRLQGVLYATWLGEYVALEVGTMHYVAMAVALLIAILTTTEIMWQNVNERKPQLAVLKATGWRDGWIRSLVLTEGMLTGLFAGLIGLLLALAMIGYVYNQFPVNELLFLSVMLFIPVVTGVLGALLPAQRAVQITPNAAIGSVAVNTQATERRFKLALGTIGVVLVAGVSSLFLFATNEDITQAPKQAQDKPPAVQTTGAKMTDLNQTDSKKKTAVSQTETDKKIKKLMKKGMVQTTPGGEQINNQFFYVAPLIETPKELDLQEKPGYRFVTLPVTMQDNQDPRSKGLVANYRPSTYAMTAPDGKEYLPVDYVNHNEKAWKFSYQYVSGEKSRVDLVYQVPEDEKVLVLYASDDAFPRTVTVKIDLDAAPGADSKPKQTPKTAKQDSGAVQEIMNQAMVRTFPGDPELKKSIFRADALLPEPPKELNLPALKDEQYLTIPIILRNYTAPEGEGYGTYRPNRYTLTDADGTVYESVDYVNRNPDVWKSGYQYFSPRASRVDLVFRVPKQDNTYVLFAKDEAFAKSVAVKIEVKASNDRPSN